LLSAVPFVMAASGPPLATLARRLALADPAAILELTLVARGFGFAIRCLRLTTLTGALGLLLLLGRAANGAFDGAGSPAGLMPITPGGETAWLAAVGLICGSAGMVAMPWPLSAIGRDKASGARFDHLHEFLGLLGCVLLLGFALAPGRALALGLAMTLLPAQLLPTLLAALILPWLRGTAVLGGVLAGSAVALTLAASGLADGATAALVGLVLNAGLAVISGLVAPAADVKSRARVQRCLSGELGAGQLPWVLMLGVVWTFLVAGPGWPLLRQLTGGEGLAALAAGVGATVAVAACRFRTATTS
jgi:hypothetical protein